MKPGVFDFSALIHPSSAAAFFAEHWERKPLLLQRGDGGYYDALLSIRDIEEFISHADARYPAIRLAKGGAFFPAEAYTQDLRYGDEMFRGVPDVEKIFTEYSSGASVTLPALHRSWPPLGGLCAAMEAQLDHPVHTNVYLTPGGTDGFTPHYDTHEVFVLQVAGRKHWRVYPPPLPLPHRSQPFSPDHYTLPSSVLLEFELAAGDLLYLPRGYVHTTSTAESFSAHVTIGVTVYTWVELLSELLQRSVDIAGFRDALPPGFAHRPELRATLQERFGQLFAELGRDLDVESLSERFVRRVHAARPRTGAHFHADAAVIEAHSVLRAAPGHDYRISHEHGSTILEVDGRRIRLQSAVAPALEAICRAQSFTPESLPASISVNARLTLVRYLHGLGFLQRL